MNYERPSCRCRRLVASLAYIPPLPCPVPAWLAVQGSDWAFALDRLQRVAGGLGLRLALIRVVLCQPSRALDESHIKGTTGTKTMIANLTAKQTIFGCQWWNIWTMSRYCPC